MASLKNLRDRIAAVKATQKITKAMQMVAAAKLRRAREAVTAARPYSLRLAAVLENIRENIGEENAPRLMTGANRDDIHFVVVCTSERGLCGDFNSQITRFACDFIRERLNGEKIVKIMTVGKKGADILKREFAHLVVEHIDLSEIKQINFADADAIASKILSRFNVGEFDICTLFYSEFKSVIDQKPTARQLIPLPAIRDVYRAAADRNTGAVYEYEPGKVSILEELIPQNLSVQIFCALLENVASEMGAKMRAMDNATRNAGEMINKLSITYNRQRQAQITTELIEIIAGAEAL
ncbi:MAG: F-type H+-transporting ATPase subunit gamma [Candidatus Tokpelaia sp. JSC189]|nr:MAG: F-type H+-transporting ATPase subunit gamma [Candidatus Tokpelaia sp. JSC189]